MTLLLGSNPLTPRPVGAFVAYYAHGVAFSPKLLLPPAALESRKFRASREKWHFPNSFGWPCSKTVLGAVRKSIPNIPLEGGLVLFLSKTQVSNTSMSEEVS